MRFTARLLTSAFIVMIALPIWQAKAETTQGSANGVPVVSEVGAPPGTEALAVQWMRVAVPNIGVFLIAVARPSGAGPFPSVLILHGSHGFAQEYVRLARDLAQEGLIALAPCWFQGGGGAGAKFITSISCPEAPPMPNPPSPEAMQIVDALMHVVRTLPETRADHVGLLGHSRGGGAALNYILKFDNVQAVVLNSSGYPPKMTEVVSQINVPILMLHGTADSPEDGGSPLTNVQMAHEFEAKMKAAGKPVEAVYYEGGRHNGIFTDATQYRDELQRIRSFFLKYLSN
jgi:dienelactone hydrolase